MHIKALPIFTDNYIWLIINPDMRAVVAVDPGESLAVTEFVESNNYQLVAIICTHHHFDHVGGVVDLKTKYNAPVYGPATEKIPGLTNPVNDDDIISLPHLGNWQVLTVPGHTLGHVAYYSADDKILFCGDTLFSAGCGRLFEGTPEQMYTSLQRLVSLGDDVLVYCTHEYTQANLNFAKTIEPDNVAIAERSAEVLSLQIAGQPSLPSSIGAEKKFNPFLRCTEPSLRQYLQANYALKTASSVDIFAQLRRLKDEF